MAKKAIEVKMPGGLAKAECKPLASNERLITLDKPYSELTRNELGELNGFIKRVSGAGGQVRCIDSSHSTFVITKREESDGE